MPRVFLAIPMPLAIRRTLVTCREACVAHDASWTGEKWVAPENLHVTLRFLGTLGEPDVERCIAEITRVSERTEPFRLRLDSVRAIPQRRSASLIWVAPSEGSEAVAALAEDVTRATAFLDFHPDGKRFRPHVTLCRARAPRRLNTAAFDEMERVLAGPGVHAISMSVPGVTLFASTLTPRGPVYEEIAAIPFHR